MEIEKLKFLIEKYIEEYKQLQNDYAKGKTRIELYKELMTYLDDTIDNIRENKPYISMLLNVIYSDNIYLDQFYRLTYATNEYDERVDEWAQLKKGIYDDSVANESLTEELAKRIFRNRYIPESAKRVLKCLERNIPIPQGQKYDIGNIRRILNYYEVSGVISNKEELMLINALDLYNRKTASQKAHNQQEQEYTDSLYNEIPNILTSGFQEHDKIEVNDERKESLDKFVKELVHYISLLDKEEMIMSIEKYHNYNLDDNEYNYIIIGLLNYYLEQLLTFYQLLIDKEIYIKRKDRLDIVKAYYEALDIYVDILNYYNENNKYEPGDDETPTEELPKGTKKVIYSHSQGTNKIKIISDMKNVPYEYYDRVLELVEDFKNDKLSKKEIKPLTNNHKITQFLELRYDQVRIVLKHINNNVYCIMGVFVKKSNNDITMYTQMANRPIPSISTDEKLERELELSQAADAEMKKIVSENARRGTR